MEEQQKELPAKARNFLVMKIAREELKKKEQAGKEKIRKRRYQKAVDDFQKEKRKVIAGAVKEFFIQKKHDPQDITPRKLPPTIAGISLFSLTTRVISVFILCL